MLTKQDLHLQLEEEVFTLLRTRPELSQPAIASMLGVSTSYVQGVAKRRRVQREPGRKKKQAV